MARYPSKFIADKTCDLSIVPDVQADPEDKAICGIWLNSCSATLPFIEILRLLGILFSTDPFILKSNLERTNSDNNFDFNSLKCLKYFSLLIIKSLHASPNPTHNAGDKVPLKKK